MDVETSTQSDSDSENDSPLTQPYLRVSSILAGSPRNRPIPSVAQQYAQLQLRRAAHRPYFSVTSASGGSSSISSGGNGGSGSRPTSRSSHITFGTLKKSSMPSRPSTTTTGTKAKLTVLPTYLQHTSFLDHFQPEGVLPPSTLPPTGSSPDHESTKRRRLTDLHSNIQHSASASASTQARVSHFNSHQHLHALSHIHHPHRRHHFRRSSDSSSSSSSSGSSGSGSGSDSGHSHSSDHIAAGCGGASLADERPPLKYQLPSRWSSTDKLDQMELSEDDLQVKYIGIGAEDKDAASIRANRPIPPQCGWDPNSWGYHGDDGHSFGGSGRGKPFGPTFTTGDTVGCGVNFRDNTLFYTKNGVYLGVAFRDLKGPLYPTVGMRTPNEAVETNFGQREFVFNIVDHVKDERMESWRLMEESIVKGPPLQLDQNIASLVLSYMIHHGYSESAKQFAQDICLGTNLLLGTTQGDHKSLGSSSTSSSHDHDSNGAMSHEQLVEDTVKRKAIRHAILEGDIDRAIDMIQEAYQGVLDTEEDVMLQLQCRKFIEMVRNASSYRRNGANQTHEKAITERENGGDHDMEVDEPMTTSISQVSSMDKEKSKQKNKAKAKAVDDSIVEDGPAAEELNKLEEAIEFGQSLQQQYKDDRRPIVQRMLVDAFSVLAYTDVDDVSAAGATKAAGSSSESRGSTQVSMLSREGVADAVNLAILASQQLPTEAPLETIYRQTKLTFEELTRRGVGSAAFFDVQKDCF
ncbi:hypothetical protein BGW41_007941 [Actinomortierella wolfii]|nr:hypothetical protein BGW41_007941 [Actinomortierella wolfii]